MMVGLNEPAVGDERMWIFPAIMVSGDAVVQDPDGEALVENVLPV
jgi:hypothetical protein